MVLWLCLAAPSAAGPDDVIFPDPVVLTAEDIAWFRGFTVEWIYAEAGSPLLVPPSTDIGAFWDSLDRGERRTRYERVYLAFMLYGDLRNGTYDVDPERLTGAFPATLPDQLTVTADHRRLLSRAWWRPGFMDPKYPFGSYNYTEADIATVLGDDVPVDSTGTFDLPADREVAYMALYHELPAVLAIWITHADLAPGAYRLPIDGWDTYGGLRETPATDVDAAQYLRARNILRLRRYVLGPEGVDMVIDWMRITDAFAGKPWDDRP